jgi:cell wall-associated NlpC family hydrolase
VHESTSHRRRRTVGTGPIALSLGLSLAATQLIGTPAASAAPAPVTAAASAAVKPKLTNSYNRKSVKKGQTVRVTAKLINPKTGKGVKGAKVRLQIRGAKAWKTWVTRSTDAKGGVSILTKPGSSLYYRTVFSGGKGYTAVRSGQTKITVRVTQNQAAKVLAEAAKHKGAPYKFGASGPNRFDCSRTRPTRSSGTARPSARAARRPATSWSSAPAPTAPTSASTPAAATCGPHRTRVTRSRSRRSTARTTSCAASSEFAQRYGQRQHQ